MIHQPHQQQAHTLTSPFARAHLATALRPELAEGGAPAERWVTDETETLMEAKRSGLQRERERESGKDGEKELREVCSEEGGGEGQSFIIISQGCRLRRLDYTFSSLSCKKKKKKKKHTPQKIQPCQPASAHSLTLQYVCVCVSVCVCEEFLSNFQQVSIKMTGTTNEFCCAIWN